MDAALSEQFSPSTTFIQKKIDKITQTAQTLSMSLVLASIFIPAVQAPASAAAMIWVLSSLLPVVSYNLEIQKFKKLQIEKGKYIQHDPRMLHAGTWAEVLAEAQRDFTPEKMTFAKQKDVTHLIEKRKVYKKYAYAIFYSTITFLAVSFSEETIIETGRPYIANISNRYNNTFRELKLSGVPQFPIILQKRSVPENLDQFINGPLIKTGLLKDFTNWLTQSNFLYLPTVQLLFLYF